MGLHDDLYDVRVVVAFSLQDGTVYCPYYGEGLVVSLVR